MLPSACADDLAETAATGHGRVARPAASGRFVATALGEVIFGEGCIETLDERLARDGAERVMLFVSASIASSAGLMPQMRRLLGGRLVAVHAGARPHNPDDQLFATVRAARERGVDALLSVGGSSQNELAKGVSLVCAAGLEHPAELAPLALSAAHGGSDRPGPVIERGLPIYAVPTTFSAGEFTDLVGITDCTAGHKRIYRAPTLAARTVLLDPLACTQTPLELLLSSGVKAIDHCIEALLSCASQPYTDALAERALIDLVATLPLIRRSPSDLTALLQAQVAAWMSVSGLANITLGLSHGLGHQLGALAHVPHGLTSCVMLRHVVAFNLQTTESRQNSIAALAWPQHQGQAHLALADRLLHLIREQLHLPWRLRDMMVNRTLFGQIAAQAMVDPLTASNPRTVDDVRQIIGLLEDAW